jgi:hypothetical protein
VGDRQSLPRHCHVYAASARHEFGHPARFLPECACLRVDERPGGAHHGVPPHTFVLPNGVLDPHGVNTLALAVTSAGGAGDGLERVQLTTLDVARGGVPVRLVDSPSFRQVFDRDRR